MSGKKLIIMFRVNLFFQYNTIIALLFFIFSCQFSVKEYKTENSDGFSHDLNPSQSLSQNQTYIIRSATNYKIDTITETEENTYYSKKIEKEKIEISDSKIALEIEKTIDSIIKNRETEFEKNLNFYKEENLLVKLVERPAELNIQSTYIIINQFLISIKIEVEENFPLGTIYPYHQTIPLNYSIMEGRILANSEILSINDSIRSLIKARLTDPLIDAQENINVSLDNITEKGNFKILLTNQELLLYYFDNELEEENYISFTYDEVLTSLQPSVKNIIQLKSD